VREVSDDSVRTEHAYSIFPILMIGGDITTSMSHAWNRISLLLLSAALLLGVSGARADEEILLGGGLEGWKGWSPVVDGVMGGKSSGDLEVIVDDDSALVFSGDIVMDGGGFSSARRRLSTNLDLTSYQGLLISLDSLPVDSIPMALQLSLTNSGSFYSFGAHFSLLPGPPGTAQNFFLPLSAFNKATAAGFSCRGDVQTCTLNTQQVNSVALYVLFQPGPFSLRVRRVAALKDQTTADITGPLMVPLPTSTSVSEFLQSTIVSGVTLFDKGYPELAGSLYFGSLATISAAEGPSGFIKGLACAGLFHVNSLAEANDPELGTGDEAWILRRVIDTIRASIDGRDPPEEKLYPIVAHGEFLSDASPDHCLSVFSSPRPLVPSTSNNTVMPFSAMETSATGTADAPGADDASNAWPARWAGTGATAAAAALVSWLLILLLY